MDYECLIPLLFGQNLNPEELQIYSAFIFLSNEEKNEINMLHTRVDPIIQKVIKLQLHIMASMKCCSHRTFKKGSYMELNFYENFYYIMKRREKVCFKKTNLKKILKLSLKRTENYEKLVVIELHKKRKKIGEK